MSQNVLVIGANGGIAQAIVQQLEKNATAKIYTVSRDPLAYSSAKVEHIQLDSSDEHALLSFVEDMRASKIFFNKVICTTGVLHTSGAKTLKPEKRLEDINPLQLSEYFRVNTIVPALWLKHLIKIIAKDNASIVFFSARVGSISENELGGWYGYRASKAALNMMVKTASVEYKRRSPNTILACYHPGTVDTALSKPFQGNVKPGKLFSADFTASQLLNHMTKFTPELSPYYIDWDGETIAY